MQAADLAASNDDIRFCALADERCPRVEVEFRAPRGGVSPRHLSAKMVEVDDGNATPSDPDDTSGSDDAGGSATSGGLDASTMRGGSS